MPAIPVYGTSEWVGLSPTTPHQEAGAADRAALVAADGEVDAVVAERRRRAARGAARRALAVERVARRPVPARLAAAREGEVVHVRDAHDLGAGAQDPVGHRRVVARHEALEDRRAAGQRDAGDRDGVLHRDALSREDALAALGAHAAAAHDRVERVLLGARARRPDRARPRRARATRAPARRARRARRRSASATASSSPASSRRGLEAPAAREPAASSEGSMRGTISRSRNGLRTQPSLVRGDGLHVEEHLGELPGAVLLAVAVGVAAREPDRLLAGGRRDRAGLPGGTRCRSR